MHIHKTEYCETIKKEKTKQNENFKQKKTINCEHFPSNLKRKIVNDICKWFNTDNRFNRKRV